MRSQIVGLRVAAGVFGLIAAVQVGRLLIRPDVMVNGYHLPLWPSVLAAVVLGGLCAWLLVLSSASAGTAPARE